MSEPFFILPNGDAELALFIGTPGNKPTHRTTAAGVLKAVDDAEHWKMTAERLQQALDNERQKIRRLMAALADEVVR